MEKEPTTTMSELIYRTLAEHAASLIQKEYSSRELTLAYLEQIDAALTEAKTIKGKPTCIVQKTIKGKGVSFMENQCGWHGTAPNKEQYEAAMAELTAKLQELEG